MNVPKLGSCGILMGFNGTCLFNIHGRLWDDHGIEWEVCGIYPPVNKHCNFLNPL